MTLRVALVSTPFVSVPPKGYGGTELVDSGSDGSLLMAAAPEKKGKLLADDTRRQAPLQ